MSDLDDLPEPPPGPSEPFNEPYGGGYLAGTDDQEIRKIRRKISPVGKLLFLVILAGGAGIGYFMAKSAMDEAALERSTREGREELRRVMAQALPPAELASQVRAIYGRNRSPEVRMSARRLLAGMHDAQSVPMLIDGLRGAATERRQSALGLAEIGLPAAASARDALAEVLPRTDPRIDRVEVAWAMVVLQDPRGWDMVLELLGSGQLQQVRSLDDPPHPLFDATLVSQMAGRERLVRLATDARVPIRRIAALSLAEIPSADVIPTLITLSRDRDADIAREAAVGLGRSGDPRAAEPISEFLRTHNEARDAVLTALQQNSGAPGLGIVLATPEPAAGTEEQIRRVREVRSQASRLLRELQDPGAGDVFVNLLTQAPPTATEELVRNVRRNAIFGLAEIGDRRAAAGLMELAELPSTPGARVDPNVDADARLALEAIRRIPGAAAEVKDRLIALIPRAEFMRTQILIALGGAGDPSLASHMMEFLANPQFQEGAAVAICRLHYAPGIAQIRTQMRRPPRLRMVEETVQDEEVFIRRRNAIRAIAWTADPTIAVDLMRIVDDPDDRRLLREEAGHSLSAVVDDRGLEELATRALDDQRPEEARMYYVYALRGRSTPQISNRLIEHYLRPGVNGITMRAAAVTAGFGGDDSTAALLRPLFASTDTNVRTNAAMAGILCGDSPTASALLDALGANAELAALIAGMFVTRNTTANNTGAQAEPYDLLPITESMFTDGRVYRRITTAQLLERGRGANRHDFAMVWLRLRIRNGWENAIGIGPYAIRARLREAAAGSEPARSEAAFWMLHQLSDRGSLLFLRRGTGPGADRARRELLDLAGAH